MCKERLAGRSSALACAWLVLPLLAGCAQGPTRQAVDAEAAAVLADAQPITAPLRASYAAGPPQRMQAEARMQLGGQALVTTMLADQHFVGAPGSLTYALTIGRMVLPQQTLECGSQPLLSVQATVASDGRLGASRIAQTPGCPASASMMASGNPSEQLAGLWTLPASGLQTGTVLRRAPGADPNKREGDARGVVAGQTVWHGRQAVVIRLEGCGGFRVNAASTWIPICLRGVSLLDPATGLTIGALGNGDAAVPGGGASMDMRMVPRDGVS